MVLGAANSQRGRVKRIEPVGQHAREVIAQQGVGRQRQVATVLLGGPEGQHDGVAPGVDLRPDLRPCERVELDRGHLPAHPTCRRRPAPAEAVACERVREAARGGSLDPPP